MKASARLHQIKANLGQNNPAIKEPFLSYQAIAMVLDELFPAGVPMPQPPVNLPGLPTAAAAPPIPPPLPPIGVPTK